LKKAIGPPDFGQRKSPPPGVARAFGVDSVPVCFRGFGGHTDSEIEKCQQPNEAKKTQQPAGIADLLSQAWSFPAPKNLENSRFRFFQMPGFPAIK
jgi:hypothetical protein